jgi:hypothetical protein
MAWYGQTDELVGPELSEQATATNLSAVTIDPKRAGVGCDAKINVTSDGPITVTLGGCGVSARAPAGRSIVG